MIAFTLRGIAMLLVLLAPLAALAADSPPGISSAEALERLKAGNERLLAGESEHPDLSLERILDTGAHGQHPFATILGCSDSRVPVELIFDQGIGDLFVIRVIGNISKGDEIGSLEYGVAHLNTPLLVVLGHSHCGAVTAAVAGTETEGSIGELIEDITPAVERARAAHPGLSDDELLPCAIAENVWHSIEELLGESSIVSEHVAAGSLLVVGAIYDIETGHVEWLGEHPKLAELLEAEEAVAAGS